MYPGAVGLGDTRIAAHHGQIRVSEQFLEGEQVAPVAQVGDGEGVAEAVRVNMGDASAFADAGELQVQVVAVHGPLVVCRTDRDQVVVGIGGHARRKVTPERLGRAFAELDEAGLVALAVLDGDAVAGHVNVFDPDTAQLRSAQPGVDEEQDDAAVAIGNGAELHGADALPRLFLVADGEQSFQFFSCKSIDHRSGGRWRFDGAHDVRRHELLFRCPAPQC